MTKRKFTKKLFIIGVLVSCAYLAQAQSVGEELPAGNYATPEIRLPYEGPIYTPPASSKVKVKAGSPKIYEYSRDAGPDETFFAVGSGLTDSVRIWGISPEQQGGQFWKVGTQFATDSYTSVTIPQQAQDGPFLVWFKNEKGWSSPVRLNVPQAWWCSPDKVKPGNDVRIFGRDLARRPDRTTAFVYMTHQNGYGQWLEVKYPEKYTVTVHIPEDIEAGSYQIWPYAGAGGDIGWGSPINIRVEGQTSKHVSERIKNVPASEGSDNKLQSLIDEMSTHGGGTIQLEAGTYYFKGTLRIPGGVVLSGKGKDVTRLQLLYDVDAAFPRWDFPLPMWGTSAVWLTGSGSGIQELTVSGNAQVNVGITVRSEDQLEWIECCRVEGVRVADIEGKQVENCGIRLAKASYAVVRDNEIWGRAPIFLSGVRQSQFINNRLVSVTRVGGNAEAAILSRCEVLEECIIEGNRIACPPGGEAGGPTARRMIWISTGRGSVTHNWLADNGVEEAAGPGAYVGAGQARFGGVAGTEQNVGEMILFEANHRTMYFGKLAEGDKQSVTLPKTLPTTPDAYFGSMLNGKSPAVTRQLLAHDDKGNETPFWPPDIDDGGVEPPIGEYYVSVFKGTGQGQTRRVIRREGERLILDRPWIQQPTDESTVVVSTAFYQNLIVGNNASDGMTGIQLWISCIENIIAGNSIARQRKQGIFLYANGTTLASSMPRSWNRGISPLFFNHVEGTRAEECSEGAIVTSGDSPLLPIEFPRALGNTLRHNSFIGSRKYGVNITSRKADAVKDDTSPSIVGTIVEFNVVRDAPVAYHAGNLADGIIFRRNHAYFWYPVNNDPVSNVAFLIQAKDAAHIAIEANSIEGKEGVDEENIIKEQRE